MNGRTALHAFGIAAWIALAPQATQAGDLPATARSDALRACPAFGEGFYYIPGSDVCLQIGGRIRFEILLNEIWSRSESISGSRARGRFDLDARNMTEYGVLRASTRMQWTWSTGSYSRSTPAYDRRSTYIDEDLSLARAYIQFAGFTAGRFVSFFDFYGDDLNWGGKLGSSRGAINGAAYTAAFGSGISASISAESPIGRAVTSDDLAVGGMAWPEAVANLRVDSNWGSAQLSAALHQIRPLYTANFTTGDSAYGWAVQAGLKLNLPVLAAGDEVWAQAAYTEGALSYVGLRTSSFRVGGLRYDLSDAYAVNNRLALTSAYALTGAAQHYWTATVRQAAFATYTQADPDGMASNLFPKVTKAALWQAGSNVTWAPLKDLEVGAELMWFMLSGAKTVSSSVPSQTPLNRDTGWQYRMRLQRDF